MAKYFLEVFLFLQNVTKDSFSDCSEQQTEDHGRDTLRQFNMSVLLLSPMADFCSTVPKITQYFNVAFSIFNMNTVGTSPGNMTEIENCGKVLKPAA